MALADTAIKLGVGLVGQGAGRGGLCGGRGPVGRMGRGRQSGAVGCGAVEQDHADMGGDDLPAAAAWR